MFELAALAGLAIISGVIFYVWRLGRTRSRVLSRLGRGAQRAASTQPETAVRSPATRTGGYPLARRFFWLPWALTIPAGLLLYFLVGLPWPYCLSLAVISGLLGMQFESFLANRKAARLETQLADAVDIMVGALGAGAGVAGAIESAIQETRNPLRRQLEEILGRIRLGDQPAAVFQSLAQRVPLETFLLFSSALAVHWETGGSLAPTMATVGRTIRDRIEVSRRIRSNTAQSQISTLMLLGLTYFIALIVYGNGPEQMKEFLATSIGSFFAAGSMLLQAVGIVWMSYISRMKF